MTATLKISPDMFLSTFLEISNKHSQQLRDVWYRTRDYTKLMRSVVLPDVADKLGVFCYNRDYYTLDAVFYQELDTQHFRDGWTYVKYISVALEHENDPTGTAAEMNKLQLFNAPLKVLITYPNSASQAEELLAKYGKIISESDIFGDIKTSRRQLVIFGVQAGGSDQPPAWQGYTYTGSGFEPIQ